MYLHAVVISSISKQLEEISRYCPFVCFLCCKIEIAKIKWFELKEVLTALLVVFLLASSLSFSPYSFGQRLSISSYCLLKVVVLLLLFWGPKRPPNGKKMQIFLVRKGFFLSLFLLMLFSFVVVVVVFVVMQMIVWYASKSIQNIILNENYIINKSIVVKNSLRSRPGAPFFLGRRKKSRGRDMPGACYAG